MGLDASGEVYLDLGLAGAPGCPKGLGRREGPQEAGKGLATPNWAQVCTMAEAPQGRTWS